jgi:putative transposase
MPDHLHLLLEGAREDSDLRTFMRAFKQASAIVFARNGGGRLWQKGYFEHVLRDDEDTTRVIRYIAANPVRAGLAMTPLEHPFTGSDVFDLAALLTSLPDTCRPG